MKIAGRLTKWFEAQVQEYRDNIRKQKELELNTYQNALYNHERRWNNINTEFTRHLRKQIAGYKEWLRKDDMKRQPDITKQESD